MRNNHLLIPVSLICCVLLSLLAGGIGCNKAQSNDSDDTDSTPGSDGDSDSDSDGDSDSDTDVPGAYSGVDILFVMDYENSISFVSRTLNAGIHTLVNTITKNVDGENAVTTNDIRIGVTTVNLGVAINGVPYDEVFTTTTGCDGVGEDGGLIAETGTPAVELNLSQINCDNDADCPESFSCYNGTVCAAPGEEVQELECGTLPADRGEAFVKVDDTAPLDAALETACLVNYGTNGCGYEQQLGAAARGLISDSSFIRPDSLTVIIVISDKNDCTIGSEEWYDVDELDSTEANLACGRHPDLMMAVQTLKNRYLDAKEAVSGKPGGVLFAAIAGVPAVSACQGRGSDIAGCLNVPVDLGGTVGDPDVITADLGGGELPVYSFLCTHTSYTGTSERHVYPAGRIVEMVQAFGNMGYLYSYCNDDWSPAMMEIGQIIKAAQR